MIGLWINPSTCYRWYTTYSDDDNDDYNGVNEFVIREILLKKTNTVDDQEFIEERVLTQFHMINWPDHGNEF